TSPCRPVADDRIPATGRQARRVNPSVERELRGLERWVIGNLNVITAIEAESLVAGSPGHAGPEGNRGLQAPIIVAHEVVRIAVGLPPTHRAGQRPVAVDVEAVPRVAGNGVVNNAVNRSRGQIDAELRVAQCGGTGRVGADEVALDEIAG